MGLDQIEYDKDALINLIERTVTQSKGNNHPRYYAIGGSHIYGTATDASDIDIYGFHTTPASNYAYFDEPEQEQWIDTDNTEISDYKDYSGIEIRSSELKHFGKKVAEANFNTFEIILCGEQIMNGITLEIDSLQSLIEDHLPLNTPYSYQGMAKSNYYKYLDPDKSDGYCPEAKKFIYVYRALLAAQYTIENEAIIADAMELAKAVDYGNETLMQDLIDARSDAADFISKSLEDRARSAITDAFMNTDALPEYDEEPFKRDIDDWMRKVRT